MIAAKPREMAIAMTASKIGMRPATTAPNTNTRTTSATARPIDSPRCSSSSAMWMISFSNEAGPATSAEKPSGASCAATASTSRWALSPTAAWSAPANVTGSSADRPLSETGPSPVR